jgi:hypothetical protein
MSKPFNDHFRTVSASYAKFHPTYPPEFFAWFAAQTAEHELAWDRAAGSG